jgi:Cu/Ag efflux protein CusF
MTQSARGRAPAALTRIAAFLATFGFLLAALPASAPAQSDQLVSGEVTKVDEPAAKITIKHGPLKKFGMDVGMTMVFQAPDQQMLKGLKPGDKIKFAPDRVNDRFTVTKIQKEK